MLTHLLNPFIKNRAEIKNRNGKWVDSKVPKKEDHVMYFGNRNIDSVDDFIIFDIPDKKVIIRSFELSYAGGDSMFYPRLHTPRNRAGRTENNLFIGMNGNLQWEMTNRYLNLYGHPLMESLQYDGKENRHKMGNRRNIVLEEGGKLLIRKASNYNPDRDKFQINIHYTTVELI